MTNKKSVKKKKSARLLLQAKHIFVPHKGNNYHPHLIRRPGLIIILTSIILGQFVYTYAVTGRFGVLGRVTDTTVSGLLDQTNQARAAAHLAPLSLNNKLNQAAYAKATDMLAEGYWAHISPSGVQPWKWLTDAGYNYNKAGENLAKNYPTSAAVVAAWLASPTHRANVLNSSYTEVGFAVIDGALSGKDTLLVDAFYGEPASPVATTAAANPAGTAGMATTFQAAPTHTSFLSGLGTTLQTINPATLGSLVLLGVGFVVAIVTYTYRKKLPKQLRRAWYIHHSLYKAVGFAVIAVLVVSLGSGQI